MKLHLYNSLTRQKELFEPIKSSSEVGVYTCGPTIYDYPTIGNWRTYTLSDFLVRTLKFNEYKAKHVMNMTDVGHLSGDNLGDASTGEDRAAIASEREGIDAWGVSDKYSKDFIDSFHLLNIEMPDVMAKATGHIDEQIDLIKKIEENGFAYKITDGVYFDVAKYESEGNSYGDLSNIDQSQKEARVEPNPEKRDPRDFALWKFFATGQKRHNMEWESPWGVGYPGWHAECSAMSMKYLGEQFDLHVGGEDLRSTHHPNEIAQSEAVTNKKPFVKYWVHGAFLLVDNGKMGKSLGNAYNLHDIVEKDFNPLALRYFYMSGHYRKQINFTWEALENAQSALNNLVGEVAKIIHLSESEDENDPVGEDLTPIPAYQSFLNAINDDLNIPQALAITWELIHSNKYPMRVKRELISEFDKVLGLDLINSAFKIEDQDESIPIDTLPEDVQELIEEREQFRKDKKWDQADEIRDQIEERGYTVKDGKDGVEVTKI